MAAFFIKHQIQKYLRRLEKDDAIAESLKKLADLHRQLGDTETAIRYYEQAIDVYYREGARLGEGNALIFEACEGLLALDALSVLAYRTLGQEYCGLNDFNAASRLYQTFAEKLVKAGQYDEAIAQYRNVLVFQPNQAELRERLLKLLLKVGRREEAAHEVRKLAEHAEKAGRVGQAIAWYKKGLQLMPSHPEIRAACKRLASQIRRTEHPLRLVVNQ